MGMVLTRSFGVSGACPHAGAASAAPIMQIATLFLIGIGTMDGIFFLSFFLTEILGMSQLDAGITVSAIPLSSILFSIIGGGLSDKLGSRWFTVAGMAIFCSSLFLFAGMSPNTTHNGLIARMIVCGAGIGLALSTVVTATTRAVPADKMGIASGIGNMSRVLGHVFGAAIVVSLFNSSFNRELTKAVPIAVSIVSCDTILKPSAKEAFTTRINAAISKKHDRIPSEKEISAILATKKVESIASAPDFMRTAIEKIFEKQKSEILRIYKPIKRVFLIHASKAFSHTFFVSGMLLLIGIVVAGFSDPGMKREVKSSE